MIKSVSVVSIDGKVQDYGNAHMPVSFETNEDGSVNIDEVNTQGRITTTIYAAGGWMKATIVEER